MTHPLKTVNPDSTYTQYGYDFRSNRTSLRTPNAQLTTYTYDALNRLTKVDFSSDSDILYAYDTYSDGGVCPNGKGRLCEMNDASGKTKYEYSKKGQVTKETKVIDNVTYVTQYSYDMNGNLKTMTYPSGKVITYNYTNDRAVGVLNGAAYLAQNINYKPFGGMSSLTYGNNATGTISYDNQYRITDINIVYLASGIMHLSYNQYDANGNITGITNNLDATKNKSFTYDALDRLATANGSWGSLGWTYDGVGNRQTQTNGGASTYAYQTGTNKLTGITGTGSSTFTFDLNGNTATENARQYTYSQNGRLIQVVDGAMTAGYTYNGNGQRVKKVVSGVTTIFHYDQRGQLIAESDNTGNTTAEYVYLNGQPLAKIEGANTYYYHNDHLGTPQKMTDSSGAVVWSADYKPFGEATITVSTVTNNLRFPGQYFDVETGNHYNYYRDYNPVIGRYIEADPLYSGLVRLTSFGGFKLKMQVLKTGRQKDASLYQYVGNNPNSFVDILGLFTACPLNTPCPGIAAYGPTSIDHCACWCQRLNNTTEDRCKCMSDPLGDDNVYEACMDCGAKAPISTEQACVCACKAAGGKMCDKICGKICK